MNKQDLSPGDCLLDKAGFPAIQHHGPDGSSLIISSHNFFMRLMDGEITPSEYAEVVSHHVDIQLAYDRSDEFPAGTTVRHAPEEALSRYKPRGVAAPLLRRIFGLE